jgi:hypothetical protein
MVYIRDKISQKRSKIYIIILYHIFMKFGRKRSKICIIISYHFLLENDMEMIRLKTIPISKKNSIHRKRNHQIENVSISIDNSTSNQKHHIQHEWPTIQHEHYYAVCLYYNHTWLTTTKFFSQQVYVEATNLPASLLATVVSVSWGLRAETEVIYVGLYYWVTLGLGVP